MNRHFMEEAPPSTEFEVGVLDFRVEGFEDGALQRELYEDLRGAKTGTGTGGTVVYQVLLTPLRAPCQQVRSIQARRL